MLVARDGGESSPNIVAMDSFQGWYECMIWTLFVGGSGFGSSYQLQCACNMACEMFSAKRGNFELISSFHD